MNATPLAITIDDVVAATGGFLEIRGDHSLCSDISIDSRTIAPGSLFIPLKGRNYDGHDFLAQASASGARAVLVGKQREHLAGMCPRGISVVVVADTLAALGDLARWWRLRWQSPVIVVTGSSGKTTTKEMIAAIGGQTCTMIKSEGNLNNCIGLPLSLLRLRSHHGAGVFEVATNSPGEIGRLADIASPDVGVITNVGPAHLQGLGSIEAVREEKGALFSFLKKDGMAIINRDDRNIRILEDRWRGKSISFGITEQATVRAEHIFSRGGMGVSFTLKIGALSRGIDMTTLGTHNIYNALAAAAACRAIDIPFEEICSGLSSFRQVPGRMTVTELSSGAKLIDDTYNANPASTDAALKTLSVVRGNGRSVVIFGDMLELGDQAVEKHREAGALMATTGVDMLLLTGEQARSVADGARLAGMDSDRIHFVESPDEVLPLLRSGARSDLWILVKGSRGMKMERFSEVLRGEEEPS